MRKILYLLLLFPILALAQSTDQNWVKTKTYKDSTKTSIPTPTVAQAVTQVSYFDGLGRPIQQVAHAQSNSGKDIVTHIEYDALGRQVREYLPFVSSTGASLNIKTDETISFYGSNNVSLTGNPNFEITQFPFSEKQFESSPLNRVLKQAAPSEIWGLPQTTGLPHDRSIKFDYQAYISTNLIKNYTVTSNWDVNLGLYEIPTSLTSSNDTLKLYKTITKDENWKTLDVNNNTTEEFKNKEGQVVLKRTYNNNIAHDTYYVYDQFGNLTFVIPPAVETSITITLAVLKDMCYQYKYDARNRLVEKKLPGKQWEYIVYDKLDRVVATGPAYNPWGGGDTNKGWLITKYDVFNRPVYTAWYNGTPVNSSTDRKKMQTSVDSSRILSENKSTATITIDAVATKYTNTVFPTNFKLLTVNYYDSYDYPNAPPIPAQIEGQNTQSTNLKGMQTGSWVRVLDAVGSTSNELSYTIYDTRYRPIRSYTTNYLGGYTQVDSKLDWAGKILYTITSHTRSDSDELIATR
jgi:YD repeat-containing protein